MKHKHIFLLLIIIVLFLAVNPAFAAVNFELHYPSLPMVGSPENCAPNECLAKYISYWFTLLTYVAGIIAIISFTVGAIGLISPNAESHNEAKDRMKGSIFGLVLTLSAFVILQTINLSLVTPQLTPLPGAPGIYYAKGSELSPVGMSENDFINSQAHKDGYNQIVYKCSAGPALLVWLFPKSNLEQGNDLVNGGVRVQKIPCGGSVGVGGSGSFKMTFETPGIYYFLNDGCQGYSSEANTAPQNQISIPFAGKIRSIKIVNDSAGNTYYGVIFHDAPDIENASNCTYPVFSFKDDCINLSGLDPSSSFTAFSADIFTSGKNISSASGDGVWFYSDVNGWDSGNKSGVAYLSSNNISDSYSNNANAIRFDYTGAISSPIADRCDVKARACSEEDADPSYCCPCGSPADWKNVGCGGSIRFGGNRYIVTLFTNYKDKSGKEKMFCQSFKKDSPTLSTAGFLPPLNYISIIPIR